MYRAVIIGCGAVAGGYEAMPRSHGAITHAGAYRKCPQTQIVGVVDTDENQAERFAKRWQVSAHFSNLDAAMDLRPDIVSICVPTEFHHDVFMAACQAQVKAVFCEKPLAINSSEAIEMIQAAAKCVVALNYFRRWNPDLEKLQAEIHSGTWGPCLNVTARYSKGFLGNGSHLLHWLLWFFGEPESCKTLKVCAGANDPGRDVLFSYSHGPAVIFQNVPTSYVFIDIDMLFEKGRVVIGQRGQIIKRERVVRDDDYGFMKLGDEQSNLTAWDECFPRAVDDIVSCITLGKRPKCSVADGEAVMRLYERVLAS